MLKVETVNSLPSILKLSLLLEYSLKGIGESHREGRGKKTVTPLPASSVHERPRSQGWAKLKPQARSESAPRAECTQVLTPSPATFQGIQHQEGTTAGDARTQAQPS